MECNIGTIQHIIYDENRHNTLDINVNIVAKLVDEILDTDTPFQHLIITKCMFYNRRYWSTQLAMLHDTKTHTCKYWPVIG